MPILSENSDRHVALIGASARWTRLQPRSMMGSIMLKKNSFNGGRILLVEDDLLVVIDLMETLQSLGAHVIGPIPNIDQALGVLSEMPGFIGAILDLHVQGGYVFPVAEELSRRNIPYVFSTGYDESAVPPEYAHVRRFSKPAEGHEIAAELLEAVQRTFPESR